MKIKLRKFTWSKLSLPFIAAVCVCFSSAIRLNEENRKNVIRSDGAGYYAYLPAIFIYHDLSYQFAEKNSPTYQIAPGCDITFFGNRTLEGKRINKYFIGTSILQFPFFVLAVIFSKLFGLPVDGYSFFFQVFIALAGIFYLLAGLFCVWKVLLKFNFADQLTSSVLLILFFGTNLFHYALEEPSLSHVYSFFLIAFFILQILNLNTAQFRKKIFLLTITFSLIILVRPVNGIIILLLPFLVPNFKFHWQNFFKDKFLIFYTVAIFLLLLFLQPIVWKIEVGTWLADSYKGEELNLLHPHLFETLFSWRKGLFIYTPVLLISIAGLFLVRPHKTAFSIFLFLFINTWIISSWHDTYYGGSFGMRPFIDTFAVFAIPLAFFLARMKTISTKLLAGSAILFFVVLNLFQTYQYHFSILPYDEMNWYQYQRLFFRGEKVFIGIFSPGFSSVGVLPANCKLIQSFTRDFETDSEFTNRDGIVNEPKSYSPPNCVRLDYKQTISPDLFVKLSDVIPDSSSSVFYVDVKAKIWLDNIASNAKLVIAFKDNKNILQWNGFYIVHRVDKINCWCNYEYALPIPKIENKNELVSAYVLKDDNSMVFLDNLEVSFWEKK